MRSGRVGREARTADGARARTSAVAGVLFAGLAVVVSVAACGIAKPDPSREDRGRAGRARRHNAAAAADPVPDPPAAGSEARSLTVVASARSESTPAGMTGLRLRASYADAIESRVEAAIAARDLPGAVVVIGRGDGAHLVRAYGARALVPRVEPMTTDTMFDVASLTKVVVTTPLVLMFAPDLDAPVAAALPSFGRAGKRGVTYRDLLTHRSGLPGILPLSRFEEGAERAYAAIDALAPIRPGRFTYSDLGFVVLGRAVERLAGAPLDEVASARIFVPLAMGETTFRPDAARVPRIAPTEETERRTPALIRGVVHDPRAFRLGGVAGNAGVFSTAADLTRFARAMLGGGALDGVRILPRARFEEMVTPQVVPGGGTRALGWDVRSGYGRHRPPGMTAAAFGHGGYTGVSLWIDPALDAFVLFLSNRVHPTGVGDAITPARDVGVIAMRALADPPPYVPAAAAPSVETGLDVVARDGAPSLEGKRLAVLTHDAARTADGRRSLDVLAALPGARVVQILSPEHGFDARHEGPVGRGVDARTGAPIRSLFGRSRELGERELDGVDVVVVDLVDVGTRFYTYASTVRRVLEAAARARKPVVLLDRPNPLGGVDVAGPSVEAGLESYVNHHPIPVVHGLTLGELALLLAREREIEVALDVVWARGWSRDRRFVETSLPWFQPSPNLPTPRAVDLYPAVGLVESTPIDVGRGTDTPFEVFGSPWLDARRIIEHLEALAPAGVRFAPVVYTAVIGPHARKRCRGVRVSVVDRAAYEPFATGNAILSALFAVHRREWDRDRLAKQLGSRRYVTQLEAGASAEALAALAAAEAAAFLPRRASVLHYR